MKRHCSLRKLKVVAFCDIRYFTVDLIMNLVHYIVMDCFFLYFSKNIVSSKKTMYEKSDDMIMMMMMMMVVIYLFELMPGRKI